MINLNNNIEIPQMGVGTWTLRGETATNNVCMALKAGFRHIDTAQMYENINALNQNHRSDPRNNPDNFPW